MKVASHPKNKKACNLAEEASTSLHRMSVTRLKVTRQNTAGIKFGRKVRRRKDKPGKFKKRGDEMNGRKKERKERMKKKESHMVQI